ncbi:sulfurtransferase [Galbibacter sp. PAP.153]|uniref:sulfurtransferase n=1 Tax=Galbibacter sp. PAP.153 TaxID=3104623 RepID=UPI003008219C
METPIVSVEWLHLNINDPDLIILDASLPSKVNDEIDNLGQIQIKNARYFNLKENFSDQTSVFPSTFPDKKQFETESRKLGINNNSKIIIYDNMGIYSSPRAWWMYKVMGHHNVAVLNGGLPEWIAKGYKTVPIQKPDTEKGNFTASIDRSQIKNYPYIKKNIEVKQSLLIDARSSERYNGIAPDPRKGLKSGHIPNSINIPYTSVLKNGKIRNQRELIPIFEKIKHENPKALTFTCGSGITACIVLLASELVVNTKKSVYDGSWTEWATLEGLVN